MPSSSERYYSPPRRRRPNHGEGEKGEGPEEDEGLPATQLGDLSAHRRLHQVRCLDQRVMTIHHWHLVAPVVWDLGDRDRLNHERWLDEQMAATGGVVFTADEAVAWLDATSDRLIAEHRLDETALRSSGIATERDRAVLTEIRREMAAHGRDLCAMLAVGRTRIAHYAAYPMTAEECADHHRGGPHAQQQ